MLTIVIPPEESWNSETNQFVYGESRTLQFEHSLISLSEWEALYEKPFLSNDPKTEEETIMYLKIMCQSEISVEEIKKLANYLVTDINAYIEKKSTATWFKDITGKARASREIITSEIIYYWMVGLQIPMEAETWNLNRLFTLIKVVNDKNQPKKKMSRAEVLAQQRSLNAQRQQQLGTNG